MINKEMSDALNHQVNEELYSAYIYASMVTYFEEANLKGFAHWMRLQTKEELAHAQKIVEYLFDRGARVKMEAVEEPPSDWDSPLAVFEAAYKHECHISDCINKLSSLAIKLDDHATRVFLQWFVEEQVEEEANADDMVQQLKLVEASRGGLFMLDKQAAGRTEGAEEGADGT